MSVGLAAPAPLDPRSASPARRSANFGPAIRLEIATSLSALYDLRPEWEQLEREVEDATVYQTWAWVVTWYEHFARDKRLRLTCARDHEGRLVGVVPLSAVVSPPVVGVRLLHFLSRESGLTEYVDALVRPEHARAVAGAVFDMWDRRRGDWDLWGLPCVRVESPLATTLQERAAARGYAIDAEEHKRVRLDLPGTWDAFHAGLSRNMKKHLRKFANRLERDGCRPEMVVVSGSDGLDRALDVFLDLHQRRAASDLGRAHAAHFAKDGPRAFLRAVAHRLAEQGRLRLCLLEVGGQPVAAQIGFALGRRLYAYHSGYDPRWAWHAVMMFLFRRCVELAITEGFAEFDLGLGHDQEKLRWGGQARSVVNLTLASPRMRSRAILALWRWRRRRNARRAGTNGAVSARDDPEAIDGATGTPGEPGCGDREDRGSVPGRASTPGGGAAG
jgi:CelD/BcsL family acetyltransferase involved in cellulose biosynthesis